MGGTALVLLQLWFISFARKWTTYTTRSSDGVVIIPGVENSSLIDSVDTMIHDTVTPIRESVYHAWGPEGIDLKHVLRYINETYYDNVTWSKPVRSYQPFPAYVTVRNNTSSIFVPRKILRRILGGAASRLQMMLPHFQRALQINFLHNRNQYSSLGSILDDGGSIPILFDLSDFRGCQDPTFNYTDALGDRYRSSASVPLFTLSRSPRCRYAFPIPTYSAYEYMAIGYVNGTNLWQDKMNEWAIEFPWDNKTSQVYWRGGCKAERYWFVIRANNSTNRRFMNVRTVGNKCGSGPWQPRKAKPDRQEASMQFKAVFDIDGNSWSERLPRLLCYNSAVVLVTIDDDFEEYFMSDLIPGVHFIPANLENFTDVAKMVTHKRNDGMLLEVVKNANTWCRNHLTEERLNSDFLSILNGYVEMLNRGHPNWVSEWNRVAPSYVGFEAFEDGHGGFTNQITSDETHDIKFLDPPNGR
jgi:Glycosyl transferase family 90